MRHRLVRARSLVGVAALGLLAAPLGMVAPAAAQTPGDVHTWGSNDFGQLGDGTTSTSPSSAAPVAGLADVVDVHGGREHVIALTASGRVFTWGSNQEGQLGLADPSNRSTPGEVSVPCGAGAVTAVETGHNSSLALCANGTVWAWGLNADGQLGDGSRTLRRTPVQVADLTDAVAIAAGRDMSYAIRTGGTVVAWGDNAFGELGDGTTLDRLIPVAVRNLTEVTSIAGGRNHGLALRADGSVWAWGANAYGQLGDGTTVNRSTPVPVMSTGGAAVSGISEVTAGAHHSYALTGGGQVLSWGRNYRNELGDGTTTTRTRAVPVSGVADAVSIGSGRDHGVAVLADGSVRAWGHNLQGQIGDGTTLSRSRAVTVPGVSGATKAGGGGGEYSVVLVDSAPVANQPPTAAITSSCDRLQCTFEGTRSTDEDGAVLSYLWSFGDGSDPASSATVTHAYPQAGPYTVTLTVTDDDGATGQVEAAVVVSDPPSPSVAFRGLSTSDASTAKPTVAVPANVMSGDRLLLFLSTARNATASTPAGWTSVGNVADGTEIRSWVFSRTATGVRAGSPVQVTLDALSKTNATLIAYAGAGAPTAAVGAGESVVTTAHRTPTSPVATSGSTVVGYWVDKTSTAHGWTLPAEVTGRSSTVGSGAGMLTTVSGDVSGVASGTWPGVTATAGVSSSKAVTWSVVLPPA